jgi:hypothetical protein
MLDRLNRHRGVYWRVRMDTDPPGQWRLSVNPYGWDWRYKLGTADSPVVKRLLAKAEHEEIRRVVPQIRGNIRSIVDKMRRGAGGT